MSNALQVWKLQVWKQIKDRGDRALPQGCSQGQGLSIGLVRQVNPVVIFSSVGQAAQCGRDTHESKSEGMESWSHLYY